MTIDEIVAKAKYIQFPYHNETYSNAYKDRDVIKLPIIEGGNVLYTGMPRDNGHHYTTKYTYTYVLPVLSKLLNFPYSLDDFNLVKVNEKWDTSYIVPKEKEEYVIECFENGEKQKGDYNILLNPDFFKNHLYRELYRYPHKCSRIVNKSSKNNRKLMISGDSQIIPSLAPLAHYFREVWYFDNRTGYYKEDPHGPFIYHENEFKSFSNKYKDVTFSDVLIECYCRELNWYEYLNLQ